MADRPEEWVHVSRLARTTTPAEPPEAMSTPALVTHLMQHEHAAIRDDLRLARGLSLKVARVHGARNRRLPELAEAVCALDEALWTHLDDEEATFLARAADEARIRSASATMPDEHALLTAGLERVRDAADDFAVPDWACASYRQLVLLLAGLDARVRGQFALEEQVLLPRFVVA